VLEMPANQLTDYVLIATGRSDRQVHALGDDCFQFCKQLGFAHRPVQGQSGWIVLDAVDAVVHTLTEEMRQFYRLERLWPQAKAIDWQQELAALPKLARPERRGAALTEIDDDEAEPAHDEDEG
jgi:ribosome silencing factor RsfS/YbeB/iojap